MPVQRENRPADDGVIAVLDHGGREFNFLLPSAEDHISKAIISGSFYESRLLEFLKDFLARGSLVLDVGANIGNHTIFFAGVCGCEVEAFEPNQEAGRYLRRNIELNDLGSLVTVHEVALSDKPGRVSVDVSVPGNLGATSFKADAHGSVEAAIADSFSFDKRVALIKIDAEGMDPLVVAGARGLIKRDRPVIVAEAADSAAFDRVASELASGEYVAVGCFNATDTYVFAPSKTASERALISKMEASGLLSIQHDLKVLAKAVAAHKTSLDKVAHLQRQLSAVVLGSKSAKVDGSPILGEVERLSDEAAAINAELSVLREKLEKQQSTMLEWATQISGVAYSAGEVTTRLSHLSVDISRAGEVAESASQKAHAAELAGQNALQFNKALSDKLDLLAGRAEALSALESSGARTAALVEDAHKSIHGLSAQMDGVQMALEQVHSDLGSRLTDHQALRAQLDSVEQEVSLRLTSNEKLAEAHSSAFGQIADTFSALEDRWLDGEREAARLRQLLDALQTSAGASIGDLESRLEALSTSGARLETERIAHADLVSGALAALQNGADSQAADIREVKDALKAMDSSMGRSVDDLRRELEKLMAKQDALSNEVSAVRGEVARSAADSLRYTRQVKDALELGQREVLQKIVAEQARISSGMAGAAQDARRVEERFDALINGRIFSTLRSLKRVGAVVRSPLKSLAGRGRVIDQDAKAHVFDALPVVPSETQLPAAPAIPLEVAPEKTTRTVISGPAPESREPALRAGTGAPVVRCATVTEAEKESFQSQVDVVRSKMPPCMSRKVAEEDLTFIHRPMPEDGLISVVMTTFNTREYVEAAIGSILAQSHAKLELIVVDDGSTDGTREIVQTIADRDPRVQCISFGVNRGTYWCKNYGITKAKGVAVTFMDSDDVSAPDRLAKQYQLLANPGCAVTTCLHERRDLQGNLITVAGRTKRLAYISQMMRRGVFDVLGYFDSVRTSADDEMLRRIKRFLGADAHRTVHEVLYHAVVREASLTQDPANQGLSAAPGGLSEPRKAYSDAVDVWHAAVQKRGRTPYVPFPVVRRPFPVHERLQVAPGHFGDEVVSVCIASFPPRAKQLRQAVNSLIDQVDLVFVYLNQYEEIPDFLKHPRIVVKIGGQDLRDNGKFYFTPAVPDGYCFTVDDDIIYPKDYVQTLIRKIELYGRKACVGLHGTVFAKPLVSYFGGRRVLHFRQSLARDHVVDQLGTGTLAFHTSLWRPSCENYSETGMVDAWIAVDARRGDIPLIAVERRKAWLTPIPMPDGVPPSLFEEFKSSDERQTRLVSGASGWGVGIGGDSRAYIEDRVNANGDAFASQLAALQMIEAASEGEGQRTPALVVKRELFKLAVVGRTNKERWKKGGILKSTHLTADMLKPLGVDVALVDLETDDPRTLAGFEADIVMIYPGDPERPDFKEVISLVDHHALLGRAVLVNLSLNGRVERKRYICEQMAAWRALYGKRVALMTFGDRVEDDPALAPIADTIVAIPKTLQYADVDLLPFSERDGIFLGDYGKLCDESLLAWPVDEALEAIKAAVPEAHLFCVEQYRPKRKRDLGLEVLPFLGSEYARVLSRSRLMVSLVKYATFEMVPMEVAAMGVPVLHPKMDNSLSDYLGLGAVEVSSVDHLARSAKALYSDPAVWKGVSVAGHMVARGLAWENMAAQMYLRLLNFRTSALS